MKKISFTLLRKPVKLWKSAQLIQRTCCLRKRKRHDIERTLLPALWLYFGFAKTRGSTGSCVTLLRTRYNKDELYFGHCLALMNCLKFHAIPLKHKKFKFSLIWKKKTKTKKRTIRVIRILDTRDESCS